MERGQHSSAPWRDGGRTYGLGGRLNHREEGSKDHHRWGEKMLGVHGLGNLHLLLQWRRPCPRGTGHLSSPIPRWAPQSTVLCHFPDHHWPYVHPSRPQSSGQGPAGLGCRTGVEGKGHRTLWCAESCLTGGSLVGVSLSHSHLLCQSWAPRALEDWDPLLRPQSWCVQVTLLFAIHTQRPLDAPALSPQA